MAQNLLASAASQDLGLQFNMANQVDVQEDIKKKKAALGMDTDTMSAAQFLSGSPMAKSPLGGMQ